MKSEFHLEYLSYRFNFPVKEEPTWKSQVDRWYQLDPFAYGLVQAYTIWKPLISRKPSFILLASPGASNETDRQFAASGAVSPSKFVHTLPNVRCSPLCEVMQWSGPILCIQKDPETQLIALREAVDLLSHPVSHADRPEVWVIGVTSELRGVYNVSAFFLSLSNAKSRYRITRGLSTQKEKSPDEKNDRFLLNWFSDQLEQRNSFDLDNTTLIHRIERD